MSAIYQPPIGSFIKLNDIIMTDVQTLNDLAKIKYIEIEPSETGTEEERGWAFVSGYIACVTIDYPGRTFGRLEMGQRVYQVVTKLAQIAEKYGKRTDDLHSVMKSLKRRYPQIV
jgi:hypothetical protein